MDIIKEIKALNFDSMEYVVIGGAAMAVRGLKNTENINILVSASLYQACRADATWQTCSRIVAEDKPGLINEAGTVELYPVTPGLNLSFEEVREGAEFFEGIPFASLQDIMHIKQAYLRKKDVADINLITNYLIDRV